MRCGEQDWRSESGQLDEVDLAEEHGVRTLTASKVGPEIDYARTGIRCVCPDFESDLGWEIGEAIECLISSHVNDEKILML